MKEGFYLLVGFFLFTSIIGCGSSSNAPSSQSVGTDVIQKYNFLIEGQPATTSVALPQQLTDANWGLKEGICQQAGYDLAPYAGQNLSLTKYGIIERYYPSTSRNTGDGLSLYLWVIAKDQDTVCGYVSVREDSSLTPGSFAVNDQNIK